MKTNKAIKRKLFFLLPALTLLFCLNSEAQLQSSAPIGVTPPSSIVPQAQLVTLDSLGNIKGSVSIALDFPVFNNTGDPDMDAMNYNGNKRDWVIKHPADYQAFVNEEFYYIEIHQADFTAMRSVQQTAILQDSNLYHIIP